MLSAWPPVRSSSRPCSSQIVRSMPRNSRNAASHSARDVSGIPPLVEDRGLGRDQRALAIGADGAAFEHERDGDALEPEPLGQARPDSLFVLVAGQRRPPAVEEEVDGNEAGFGRGERRSGRCRAARPRREASSATSTGGPAVRSGLPLRSRASRPSAPARSPRSPSRRARSRCFVAVISRTTRGRRRPRP